MAVALMLLAVAAPFFIRSVRALTLDHILVNSET